jgi:hypothetical protein
MDRRVTLQDVSWFLDIRRSGQLELSPPYQRRSVWTPRDRRFFLDTIFHDYPSPPLFLHKQMDDGAPRYAVVDGKQRLETVFMFFDGKLRLPENFGDDRLNNKKWPDIKDITEVSLSFYNYVFPVEMIVVLPEPRFLNEVFDRLNRNNIKLSEQELRHAKYDGWFAAFVEEEADNPVWKVLKVRTTGRERRMRDVQFISELLMIVISKDVRGFDQFDIDQFFAEYDDLTIQEDDGFDETEVKILFAKVRDFINQMILANPDLMEWLRYVRDLYSLFASLVLCPTLLDYNPEVLAGRYARFMSRLAQFGTRDPESVQQDALEPQDAHAFLYYSNGIGASTDKAQRLSRHEALTQALQQG